MPELDPHDIEVERHRDGGVTVRHLPSGAVTYCRRHPVSSMNEDEARAELTLEVLTRPDTV
jgi:hypothetical protein